MGIIERIKKLFKKTVIIKETGISKIDTDLLFIPKFEELNKNNQAMVLKYLKEVNIKDLDSIVNYTKRISEEANFNSEFLLRLYYKLTDDNNLNNQDMLYDNYNTITEINELNLCKNELLKLHEEGILRIIALNKLYEQEISRKLSFAGVFGKFEQIKRRDDIRTLEEVTEQLKISVKIIEQLIQIVNINVDANALKVKYQDNLLSLLKNEDSNEIINKLVDEIQNLLKIFLPHYESKIIFNNENIKGCLVTLSIAKRLLDLYAYKHKDEAIDIINDIEKLCNNFNYQNDIDNIMKEIFLIESKYRLFSSYLYNNENVNGALKKLYKIKFKMLVKKNYSFNEIKNKFELMCYEEFASNMLENILKGNIAFFTSDKNLPNFSSKMQTELTQRIIETIKYNHHDLSSRGILSDSQLLKLIMALSNEYDISYQERLNLFNRYHVREKTLKKRRDDGLIPYRCDLEYVDEKENKECHENVDILNMLLKIFIDYEAYNQEKEMPYSIEVNLAMYDDGLSDKSLLAKIYLDILRNSELGIILPGVKKIMAGPNFIFGSLVIKKVKDSERSSFLNKLPLKKLVVSNDIQELSHVFKECENLEYIDLRYLTYDRLCFNKIEISNCFEDTPIKSLIMDYEFLEESSQIEYYKYVIEKINKTFNENRFCLENFLRPFGLNRVMGDADTIRNRRINNYPWTTPLSFVRPFNLVIHKYNQVYTIDIAHILAEHAANDELDGPITKRYPLANEVIKKVRKKELQDVKQLKK